MDNRKRQRLELTSNAAIPISNVASTATQSFFLSSNSNNCGVATNNVLLTICTDDDDDIRSDESHEYLAIDDSLTQIKQENSATTAALPLHYRIVNPNTVTTMSESTQTSTSTVVAATATMLPPSVQLPSGCDIYLVKDYINSSSGSDIASCLPAGTNIKLEPNERITSTGGATSIQLPRGIPCLLTKNVHNNITATTNSNIVTTAGPVASVGGVINVGTLNNRSYILETYKKRDDKRRATHNEVERRRRDKINSWIFKLKEMLPDMPVSTAKSTANTSTPITLGSTTITTTPQERCNNNGNCRTPPSDSKSQILIKACEYIKTMQDEIKSLRECLTENENLRLSNQRLQCELEKLKNERQNRNANNSNSNNTNNNNGYNITLNNLNTNGLFSTTTPPSSGVYAKRELIIRDYMD